MTEYENNRLWICRAALFELLAVCLSLPEKELAESLSNGDFSCTAEILRANLGICDPALEREEARVANHYRGENPGKVLHCLSTEYTRLFVGTASPLVPPYGSYWKMAKEGKEPILFLNQEAQEVESIMRAAGVGNPPGLKEPLDHIVCELEFMQYVCLIKAGAENLREGVSIDENLYARFLDEHMREWVSDFSEALLTTTDQALFAYCAHLMKLI